MRLTDRQEVAYEKLELLREIRLAEQQVSNGKGVPHELAREQILSVLEG